MYSLNFIQVHPQKVRKVFDHFVFRFLRDNERSSDTYLVRDDFLLFQEKF